MVGHRASILVYSVFYFRIVIPPVFIDTCYMALPVLFHFSDFGERFGLHLMT